MPVLKYPPHRNDDSIYINSWLQKKVKPYSDQPFKRPVKKFINLKSTNNTQNNFKYNLFGEQTVLVNPQKQFMCKVIKFYHVNKYNVVGLLRDQTNSMLFCL